MSLRRVLLLAIDFLILVFSYTLSYVVSTVSTVIYYDIKLSGYCLNFLLFALCLFATRIFLKVYSNVWRYANTRAYLLIVICDIVGAVIATTISRVFLFSVCYVSFWAVFINVATFTLGTLVTRFAYQYLMNIKMASNASTDKTNIAIVGAGKTGSLLAEELLYNSNSIYRPICFIDINRNRIGAYIEGVKVLEEDESIFEKIKSLNIKEIFIALPSLSTDEARKLYDFYSGTGCKIKVYDFALGESADNSHGKRKLRELKIEDLLFRNTHNINNSETFNFYLDKTVLVTGGGGSIGSEICRQIARAKPSKLIVFDIYENNVYDLQQELRQQYGEKLNLCIEMGSVRDKIRLDEVFSRHKPDVVFHAAAHKHVPLMENNCCEAIKNNVYGTYNTAECAEKHGVKRFIMISTDKAVNPTNVMGATKRLCEMIVLSRFDSTTTEFAAVRFGNVLGSNGSVIPLFRRQIEAGGPLTITDRRIIRYFMTIPEASQLVLQAGAMATKGELFVLDMGNPVKIIDLAENMIKLAGYVPYRDIDIIETGLRPGEKLYEELLIKSEDLTKTDNDLIFIETDKPLSRNEIDLKLAELNGVINGSNDDIRAVLKRIVPTYVSPEEINKNASESEEMKRTYQKPSISEVKA